MPNDFHSWTQQQAAALADRDIGGLDWDALAEEIGDMGKRERREVRSQLVRILEHMIKIAFVGGDLDVRGWSATVVHARGEILAAIADSPSLARYPSEVADDAYRQARKAVEVQYYVCLPDRCPWRIEDVLRDDMDLQQIGGRGL